MSKLQPGMSSWSPAACSNDYEKEVYKHNSEELHTHYDMCSVEIVALSGVY